MKLGDRPFRNNILGIKLALEHDLRIGRNLEIDRLASTSRNGCAEQPADIVILVVASPR